MILTDYYRFKKSLNNKSGYRIDCIASTQSYPVFENLRSNTEQLFMYLDDIKGLHNSKFKREPDKILFHTNNISEIFMPDITRLLAFGNIFETLDAILMQCDNDSDIIEIMIARGQKNNQLQLYHLFADEAFSREIETFRKQAIAEK
ncbi:MAG: hypothetical protein PARBA_03103 [Parabacteroides sp.]